MVEKNIIERSNNTFIILHLGAVVVGFVTLETSFLCLRLDCSSGNIQPNPPYSFLFAIVANQRRLSSKPVFSTQISISTKGSDF